MTSENITLSKMQNNQVQNICTSCKVHLRDVFLLKPVETCGNHCLGNISREFCYILHVEVWAVATPATKKTPNTPPAQAS